LTRSTPRNERVRQLDADLLMALHALLEDLNVTQAARRLEITQSSMSARLARLRTIFDDRLFVGATSGRGVVATPRALAMRESVSKAIAALEALVEPDDSFDPRSSARTFKIAMHDNPAGILAPTLISRCLKLAPDVKIAIVLPGGYKLDSALESGELDLLIAAQTMAHADWIGRVILKERLAMAQRSGHPRGTDPLDVDAYCALNHLIVSPEGGGFSSAVDEMLAARGRERRVLASVQSYALAPLIAANSDLVCTLPRSLLSRFVPAVEIFDPPFDLGEYELSAFWHRRRQDDPAHVWLRMQISDAAQVVMST
jgi:DNA-binding transcriptional LysR family regulator